MLNAKSRHPKLENSGPTPVLWDQFWHSEGPWGPILETGFGDHLRATSLRPLTTSGRRTFEKHLLALSIETSSPLQGPENSTSRVAVGVNVYA